MGEKVAPFVFLELGIELIYARGRRRPVCARGLAPYLATCKAIGRGRTGWGPHEHRVGKLDKKHSTNL